ncbi:MAG: hypothetical protein NT077_03805, partial [Candidatus Taylorbacteria bacterium]|nr:hypothetical protein [Candidatus Taylorbacteria bacterium]
MSTGSGLSELRSDITSGKISISDGTITDSSFSGAATITSGTALLSTLTTTGDINISDGSSYKYNDANVITASTTIYNYFFGGAGNRTMTGWMNTVVGYDALLVNTTGYENSILGYQAMESNTTGSANVAIGAWSLANNTTGNANSAIGWASLLSNTTGSGNTAQGKGVFWSNTTGSDNTAIGVNGMWSNTTGSNNVALGNYALNSNQSATSTTAIGFSAARGTGNYSNQNGVYVGGYSGYSVQTGSNNNTFLGSYSGYNTTTGANNIVIGYNVYTPSATSVSTLNIGNLIFGTGIDGQSTTLSSGGIGIGTTTPYAKFSITGNNTASTTLAIRPVSGQTANILDIYNTNGTLGTVINSSGNVGIGSTSPAYKLDIETNEPGTILNGNSAQLYIRHSAAAAYPYAGIQIDHYNSSTGNHGGSFIGFTDNGAGNAVLQFDSTSNTTTDGNLQLTNQTTNGNLLLGTNSLERMRITSSGFVGIGSSTPWGLLSVNPTALGSGVPEFVVGSSTATHFIVNGAGNVGVGITSPAAKLHIKSASPTMYFSENTATLNDTSQQTSILFNHSTTAGYATGIFSKAAGYYNRGQIMIAANNTSSDTANVTTADVNITAAPGTTDLYKTITLNSNSLSYISQTANSGSLPFYFNHGAGVAKVSLYSVADGSFGVGDFRVAINNGLNSTAVSTSDTKFIINSSGSVGIGTTSPSTLLSVGGNVFIGAATAGGTLGKLGIGTSSPSSMLDIITAAANTRSVQITDTTRTAPYFYIQSGDDSFLKIARGNSQTAGVTLVGGTNYKGLQSSGGLSFYTSSSIDTAGNGTEAMTITSGGNIGIGTTSPYTSLAVAGATGVLANIFTATSTTATSTFAGGLTVGTTKLVVDSTTGNVGIGTANPVSKVHISGINSLAAGGLGFGDGTVGFYQLGNRTLAIVGAAGTAYWDGTTIDFGAATGAARIRNYGTAATPVYTFLADDDTGMFRASADNLAFSTVGVERLRINDSGNVGIGTTTPSQTLSVQGNGLFSGNISVAGIVATSTINTSGITGGYKIDGNLVLQASTTNHAVLVGGGAGANLISSGLYNVAIGESALSVATSSDYNIAVGYKALFLNNDSGNHNIGIGYQSLYSNTIGSNNVAVGSNSLVNNTTGADNIAIGGDAFSSSIAGNSNTAIGANALQKSITSGYNVAIGKKALYGNISATSSVAIGYQAGYGLNDFYNNQGGVYVGYEAGGSAQTGSDYNTFLGYNAGWNDTTGSNNIAIGKNAGVPSASGSQQLNIGNLIYGTGIYNGATVSSSPTSGSVGIGTTSPYAKLSVVGTVVATDYHATSSTLGYQADNLLGGLTTLSTDASGNIIR